MPREPISRRKFFGQAAVVPAVGLAPTEIPRRAWILVAQGWEYNDEFAFPEGEYPQTRLYYDRAEAEAECRRQCDVFDAAQTPDEFEIDWEVWLPDRFDDPDFSEESVTWEAVRDAGFPAPFYVLELTSIDESPP